jgi:hypothetical protein
VAALKLLVIVMGVMLVAGVAVLIVVIAGRASQKAAVTGAPPFAAAPIELPPGARIEAMSTGSDRLVIDLILADGNRQLLVLDLATGRRIGTIPLRTAP